MSEILALGDAEFAHLLDGLGPFERNPVIAVALSGGPDSLAATLLTDRWARARGGSIHAIIVDHAIRPDSAVEAARVAGWMAARGIAHTVHRLTEAIGSADLQAEARMARYRALESICAEHSILHLVTGHHREDQAETFLLRLARGSGVDGLASMAPVTTRRHIRILRPLLDMPRARLAATCADLGQNSIDDPSNRNPAFARIRVRQGRVALDAIGLGSERLAGTALHLGRARDALERETALLLARAASYHPAGFARLDPATLRRASPEIGLRALARVLSLVAGQHYRPRFERTQLLYDQLGLDLDRTLGGCRLVSEGSGAVLIYREMAAIAGDLPLGSAPVQWDGRYMASAPSDGAAGFTIGALGTEGASFLRKALRLRPDHPVPPRVRATLPCIRRLEEIHAVPHLNYYRSVPVIDPSPLIEIACDPDSA